MSAVKYFLSNKDQHLQIMLRVVQNFFVYFFFYKRNCHLCHLNKTDYPNQSIIQYRIVFIYNKLRTNNQL